MRNEYYDLKLFDKTKEALEEYLTAYVEDILVEDFRGMVIGEDKIDTSDAPKEGELIGGVPFDIDNFYNEFEDFLSTEECVVKVIVKKK